MKRVRFVGSAQQDLAAFPKAARTRAGFELFAVQMGREPADWKPMPGVGVGACEIRVRDATGAWRLIYVARFHDTVYVLHAFSEEVTEDRSRRHRTCERPLSGRPRPVRRSETWLRK